MRIPGDAGNGTRIGTRMRIRDRSGARATLRVVAAAWVAVAAVGCSDPATAPLGDDGLRAHDQAGVTLLTQNVVQDVVMEALFQGRVVADDAGCLRLDSPDHHTVVWPQGYTAQGVFGNVWIRDSDGAVVGRVGESFSLGGGEVTELSDAMGFSQADRDLAEDLCPGRYWIVGIVG